MGKLVKYEFRRAMGKMLSLIVMFGVVELYLLCAIIFRKEFHVATAFTLFVLLSGVSYFLVLLRGISSYEKDLSTKEGYLLFMTPHSSYQIIGAKLLSILLAGCVMLALVFGLGAVNNSLLSDNYGFARWSTTFDKYLQTVGTSLGDVLFLILIFIVSFLVQFFMIMTVGYLAISISATLLQNKKSRSFVSFLLFLLIVVAVLFIAFSLSGAGIQTLHVGQRLSLVKRFIPQIFVYVIAMVLSYLGSAALLEKKISL